MVHRYMRLDAAASRALNVLPQRLDGSSSFSLYGIMGRGKTAMGKRLLKVCGGGTRPDSLAGWTEQAFWLDRTEHSVRPFGPLVCMLVVDICPNWSTCEEGGMVIVTHYHTFNLHSSTLLLVRPSLALLNQRDPHTPPLLPLCAAYSLGSRLPWLTLLPSGSGWTLLMHL